MLFKSCTEVEIVRKIKERLGWYCGGVPPRQWDPFKNIAHLGFLLEYVGNINPESFTSSLQNKSPYNILRLPYDERSLLIRICCEVLGII